jgi:hypothetical protein
LSFFFSSAQPNGPPGPALARARPGLTLCGSALWGTTARRAVPCHLGPPFLSLGPGAPLWLVSRAVSCRAHWRVSPPWPKVEERFEWRPEDHGAKQRRRGGGNRWPASPRHRCSSIHRSEKTSRRGPVGRCNVEVSKEPDDRRARSQGEGPEAEPRRYLARSRGGGGRIWRGAQENGASLGLRGGGGVWAGSGWNGMGNLGFEGFFLYHSSIWAFSGS